MENVGDPVLVLFALLVISVDNIGPPVRSCDSLGLSKLSGSDGAQVSAIEVEQSQPGALSMIPGGQDEHLVAVHCDVADGTIIVHAISSLIRGDDLQV